MVAEAWEEHPERDPRTGTVADRFRLLGRADESGAAGDGPADAAAPPVFGTAPWGYKRSEVDAWTSWVAGLVAHGRRETVRADGAEATLRATLERLEALQPRTAPPTGARTGRDPTDGNPTDRNPTDRDPNGGNRTGGNRTGGNRTGRNPPDGPAPDSPDSGAPDRNAPGPSRDRPEPDRPTSLPRRTPRPTAVPDPAPAPDPESARLHVVETTLHEVMALLHRLADPGRPGS